MPDEVNPSKWTKEYEESNRKQEVGRDLVEAKRNKAMQQQEDEKQEKNLGDVQSKGVIAGMKKKKEQIKDFLSALRIIISGGTDGFAWMDLAKRHKIATFILVVVVILLGVLIISAIIVGSGYIVCQSGAAKVGAYIYSLFSEDGINFCKGV